MRFSRVSETIGKTPVIALNKICKGLNGNVFVKCEAFNPGGSVKDRLAKYILDLAEGSGKLSQGQTVIEATSGNTGIGIAMICAERGYPCVMVMSEAFSLERRKLMRAFGAKVILTPAHLGGQGMITKAQELAEENGWFLCRQFETEANALAHEETTGPEIVHDFEDTHLDYFVTGYGTGGTLTGVSRVLKREIPDIKIVVCEADNSPVLAGGKPQKYTQDGFIRHEDFRPHPIQGWGPDFIPKIMQEPIVAGFIDQVLPVSGYEALDIARRLASEEGILTGISGGATVLGALEIAKQAKTGMNILAMLPDTGERYLSTSLFEALPDEMSPEETDIMMSTPSAQIGGKNSSSSTIKPKIPFTDFHVQWINSVITENTCVVFSLEYCEFCWSLLKFFKAAGVKVQVVPLDSVKFKQDELGLSLRAALEDKTKCLTIPQVFIGGTFIGGCTDAFNQYKSGDLQTEFKTHSVELKDGLEPYSFLPNWLHPR